MLKIIWGDFKEHILPWIIRIIAALGIGFLINHFTGLRCSEDMTPRWYVDLFLGSLFGWIALGIIYGIKYLVSEYLKKVKRRAAVVLARERAGNNTAISRRASRTDKINREATDFEF